MAIPYTRKEVSINCLFLFLLFYLITLLRTHPSPRPSLVTPYPTYLYAGLLRSFEDLTDRRTFPRALYLPPYKVIVSWGKSRAYVFGTRFLFQCCVQVVSGLASQATPTQVLGIILESHIFGGEYPSLCLKSSYTPIATSLVPPIPLEDLSYPKRGRGGGVDGGGDKSPGRCPGPGQCPHPGRCPGPVVAYSSLVSSVQAQFQSLCYVSLWLTGGI